MRSFVAFALLLLLPGCAQPEEEPTPAGAPRLLVSTEGAQDGALDFGRILAGESVVRSLTVQNVGDGVLRSLALSLPDGLGLTAAPAALPPSLAPGARVVVALRWSPAQDASLDAEVEVRSDDRLRPVFPVRLVGEAEGPLAAIEPGGRALSGGVGCPQEAELAVRHAGRAGVLRVGEVSLEDEVGGRWELVDDPEGAALTVGQTAALTLRWTPVDGSPDAATVLVRHDGPGDPLRASLAATPQTGPEAEDHFVQGEGVAVDLLLVVDASPGTDLAPLVDGAGALVDALEATGADWRAGVLSMDTAEFGRLRGAPAWLGTGDEDAAAALAARLPEPDGAEVPQGLHAAWQALSGINEGFRRPDGLLHLLFVSDAEDLSEPVRGWTVPEYLTEYERLALGPEGRLRVSAFTGGAAGCDEGSRHAEPEGRYSELVEATVGLGLDFCAEDWTPALAELGTTSLHEAGSFVLSAPAVPDQVEVRVDGVATEAFDFSAERNAVDFHPGSEPALGAAVDVTYRTAVCGGREG